MKAIIILALPLTAALCLATADNAEAQSCDQGYSAPVSNHHNTGYTQVGNNTHYNNTHYNTRYNNSHARHDRRDRRAERRRRKAVRRIMRRVDRNRDGYISRWEAGRAGGLPSHFHHIDRNRDGYVSRGELARSLQRRQRRSRPGRVSVRY